MKLSWEIDGVDREMNLLEEGIEAGMEKAVDQILDQLESDAKDRIAVRPYIFTGEVYESFEKQSGNADIKHGISARLVNSSKHSGALEHGVHKSKYADGAPPISALMPWVIAKLNDWTIEADPSSGGSSIQVDIGDEPDSDNDLDDTQTRDDWTRFDSDGVANADNLWIGQDVTVYDKITGSYREGTVNELHRDGRASVYHSDSDTYNFFDYKFGDHIDEDAYLVAGDSWESYSESEQRDIVRNVWDETVDVDSDFSSSFKSDIEDAQNQWIDRLKDPLQAKRVALHVDTIKKDNTINARGQYIAGHQSGTIKYNTDKADKSTIRHEIAHAFDDAHGFSAVTGFRHTKTDSNGDTIEQWNVKEMFRNGSLPYNFLEIGRSNWDTSEGDELPHPTTYMPYSDDVRDGIGVYDDVDHPGFDKWEEYVRKKAKFEMSVPVGDDDVEPDYDPFYTEKQTLDPDNSPVSAGDALGFKQVNDGREYHVETKSGVYWDKEKEEYMLDIARGDKDNSLPITEDGEFAMSQLDFIGYLPGGSKKNNAPGDLEIEESDIPDDPGFDADDPLEQFYEAKRRQLWREMLASEVAVKNERAEWYLRGDGYSAIDGLETQAHLLAIIFSKNDTTNNDERSIEKLLEHSPELLYTANIHFDFTPEMKNALERESGLNFDDLMYDIWREHVK